MGVSRLAGRNSAVTSPKTPMASEAMAGQRARSEEAGGGRQGALEAEPRQPAEEGVADTMAGAKWWNEPAA
jgi:hypothetical protein